MIFLEKCRLDHPDPPDAMKVEFQRVNFITHPRL